MCTVLPISAQSHYFLKFLSFNFFTLNNIREYFKHGKYSSNHWPQVYLEIYLKYPSYKIFGWVPTVGLDLQHKVYTASFVLMIQVDHIYLTPVISTVPLRSLPLCTNSLKAYFVTCQSISVAGVQMCHAPIDFQW